MTATSQTPGPAWKVITQVETTGRNQANNFVPGWQITYQLTGSGQTGSVFVPASSYTPANVISAINNAAALVDQVANLTSDS